MTTRQKNHSFYDKFIGPAGQDHGRPQVDIERQNGGRKAAEKQQKHGRKGAERQQKRMTPHLQQHHQCMRTESDVEQAERRQTLFCAGDVMSQNIIASPSLKSDSIKLCSITFEP